METPGLGTINWLVIIVYLLGTLGIAVYFTRRASTSSDSYFTAEGRIPAWAAGFSIYATTLSAITYMSTPEQAYLADWSYAAGNLAIFAIVPILVWFYVPFFRKLNVVTAYEYLEERFGPSVRVLGSLLFVLFHIGRVAIVIYLPTLAITSVTDIDPILIAAVVGGLAIIYTFLGGIEGVIWSDVVQGIVLLAGAFVILGAGFLLIDGGLSQVVADGVAEGKFITSANFDLTSTAAAAIPIVFLGSIFNNLHQYTASQDVVQRYQTTPTVKAAGRSLWTNGLLALLTIPLFYGMGTMMFSYFRNTSPLPDTVNTSAIVPYFVVTVLPAGLAGLVMAAIFAAAQSTISSSLNSISACVTVDLYDRFVGRPRTGVLLPRMIIVVAGLLGVGASLFLVATDRSETWNLFLSITGLFGVPLAGVFALGIFSKRANTAGVLIGVVAGAIAAFLIQRETGLTPFAVSTAAFIGAVVIGYLASIVVDQFRDRDTHDIIPLTVYGLRSDYVRRTPAGQKAARATNPETARD